MKRFDQLTPEQKQDALNRAMLRSTRKIYNGGLTSDPQVRKDLNELVKETSQKYDELSGSSFCGCTTCLQILVKMIKTSKFGQIKEIVLSSAQKDVESRIFLEGDEQSEKV